MTERRYWLFKSEPSSYSFSDLMGEEYQTAEWDGVRNYQARNFLRDEVKVGDACSSTTPTSSPRRSWASGRSARRVPGRHGLGPRLPIWFMVDIKGEAALEKEVTLPEIRSTPALQEMPVPASQNLDPPRGHSRSYDTRRVGPKRLSIPLDLPANWNSRAQWIMSARLVRLLGT